MEVEEYEVDSRLNAEGFVEGWLVTINPPPPWACVSWGGYEHDWLDCADCVLAYEFWNEKVVPELQAKDAFILALAEEVAKMSEHLSKVAERKMKVQQCQWCKDPNNPDPKYHPDGQVEHETADGKYPTSQTDHLKSLGSGSTDYKYDKPSIGILETFPNPHPGNHYKIYLCSKEFTSLCPKTGQPDFATIRIDYVPDERCVETKSLKLYLFAYRQVGAFMEDIVNKILNDLVGVLHPKWIEVVGEFASRGGITLEVKSEWFKQ